MSGKSGLAWPRRRLFNVWADDVSREALFEHLDRHGGVVFTVNPDHLYHLQRNAEFLSAYRSADIITVDSHYVRLALSWWGPHFNSRLPGSDLVPQYCRHEAAHNPRCRIFLLGAAPGVAQRAMDNINHQFSRELVVGAHGPSMNFVNDPQEIEQTLELIRRSRATAVMVGLGAPKQEIWIAQHRARLPKVRVWMGIGATIDYQAGAVQRAPVWLQKMGLEWAFRVLMEPRRYLGRYLRNTEFFWLALLHKLGRYRDPLPPRGTRS